MALWLLAISLVAPVHDLEHFSWGHQHEHEHEHGHDNRCDFFIHGQLLVTALSMAALPQAVPSQALTVPSPAFRALRLAHRTHVAIRAPPVNS